MTLFLNVQVRPARSVDELHVRRKEVDYTREGFPDRARGVCSCGWQSESYEAARAAIGSDAVDRDLHRHIVAMREQAKR